MAGYGSGTKGGRQSSGGSTGGKDQAGGDYTAGYETVDPGESYAHSPQGADSQGAMKRWTDKDPGRPETTSPRKQDT